jgi:dephospho-CoA kinase
MPFISRRVFKFAPRRADRRWPFAIIGLTGSIAMGKSTAASLLRKCGWPIYDADASVHQLYKPGGPAVKPIVAAFGPTALNPQGGIDRQAVGGIVFGDAAKLRQLESIIFPMLGDQRRHFFLKAAFMRRRAVILDIPLLFETARARTCDIIAVVSAPSFLQRQRAMARPGMTAERLKGILARQTPDAIKRRYADLVIPSGLGKREALRRLMRLRKLVASHAGRC